MRLAPAVAIAAALAAASCAYDPWDDPLPGREARVVLSPGTAPARARWPVGFRRGAEFVIENRTGSPVETVIVDFTGNPGVVELLEATILEPTGKPATVLPAPHGTWPLRARLGNAGTVLLARGESLVLLLRVHGEPARAEPTFSIPGVTRP